MGIFNKLKEPKTKILYFRVDKNGSMFNSASSNLNYFKDGETVAVFEFKEVRRVKICFN